MAETSMVWGGLTQGDATIAPYDADEHGDMLRDLFMHDRRDSGVFYSALTGFDGLLEATNPAGATLRVATGIGMVDGTAYYNSANVDNASGSAPGQFERIVLQKSWAAQTVRVAVLGPAGAQPALTQNAGVTWEIPLATVENVGGVLTFTDERLFLPQIGTDNFKDGSVSPNRFEDEPPTSRPSVIIHPIADGAATAAKFADGARSLALIATSTLGAPAASISFASIPRLYSHLLIIMSARGTAVADNDVFIQFNSDAGANYSYINTVIDETGASTGATSIAQTSINAGRMNDSAAPANRFASLVINVPFYSNHLVEKNTNSHSAEILAATADVITSGGYWSSTEVIDTVDLISGVAFATGTVASLYGLA